MPEYREFYDDGIQGQSFSQQHCKDYVGIYYQYQTSATQQCQYWWYCSQEMWGKLFLVFSLTEAWGCQ